MKEKCVDSDSDSDSESDWIIISGDPISTWIRALEEVSV